MAHPFSGLCPRLPRTVGTLFSFTWMLYQQAEPSDVADAATESQECHETADLYLPGDTLRHFQLRRSGELGAYRKHALAVHQPLQAPADRGPLPRTEREDASRPVR